MLRTAFLFLLSAFAFTSTWSQAPYFSRSYPAYPDYLAAQCFHHPDGAYSAVFVKEFETVPGLVHRLDLNGDITSTHSSIGKAGGGFEVALGEKGNHWLMYEQRILDSIEVELLDANLTPTWRQTISLDQAPGLLVQPVSLFPLDSGLLVMGNLVDTITNAPQDLWLAKLDYNGSMLWTQYYSDNVMGIDPFNPYRIAQLSGGVIAINGTQLYGQSAPSAAAFLLRTDSMGNVLSYDNGGVQCSRTGNINELADGTIEFMTSFDYSDVSIDYFHTDLATFSNTGVFQSQVLVEDDWIGEESFWDGNQYHVLVCTHLGVRVFHPLGDFYVSHAPFPQVNHNTNSYGFSFVKDRASAMDAIPLPTFGTDLLIGLAGGSTTNISYPIVTRNNLQGSGLVSASEARFDQSFLDVYPNPSKGLVNIKFATPQSDGLEMTLFDYTGKRVLSIPEFVGGPLDLSQLPNGTYLLRMVEQGGNESVWTKKVVLNRD